MKRNQRVIFEALKKLGGEATTQEIANELGRCTKGLENTLKTIKNVKNLNSQSKWKITS